MRYAWPPEAAALVARSVILARGVRDELADDGVDRRVAASVGPYGAYLADGSEYRGRYGVSRRTLFQRVVIPAALPQVIVGMRIGLGVAWLVVVAAVRL